MSLSDCPKCWDTPCTCGQMGYHIVYGTCKDCHYSIGNLYCTKLTVYDNDNEPCGQIQVEDDFFCKDFEKKKG